MKKINLLLCILLFCTIFATLTLRLFKIDAEDFQNQFFLTFVLWFFPILLFFFCYVFLLRFSKKRNNFIGINSLHLIALLISLGLLVKTASLPDEPKEDREVKAALSFMDKKPSFFPFFEKNQL